jgi:enoyl-[acyl-carrier-protein] reductase (NADH)
MGLMTGKRGIIFGVANDMSIAWGIAQQLRSEGAELASPTSTRRWRNGCDRWPRASAPP